MVSRRGGFLDDTIDPDTLPPWLTTADIEFYARESAISDVLHPSAAFVSSSMAGWRLVGRGADRRQLRRRDTSQLIGRDTCLSPICVDCEDHGGPMSLDEFADELRKNLSLYCDECEDVRARS